MTVVSLAFGIYGLRFAGFRVEGFGFLGFIGSDEAFGSIGFMA